MLVVCPLSRVPETVRRTGAGRVLTLLADGDPIPATPGIAREDHLIVRVHDIVQPLDGCTLCELHHVEQFLDFARSWNRAAPLVIHCWAGISRSTAAAFATACALAPERDEMEIAWALRRASPTATPNGRMVALADEVLGRGGRMLRAADVIGRGRTAMEGEPFMLPIAGESASSAPIGSGLQ